MPIPSTRRGAFVAVASLFITAVLTVAAHAAPQPASETPAEPSIVPLLLSGRDSSHVAIEATESHTPAVAHTDDEKALFVRDAEPLTAAASTALRALRQSHGGKTLSSELDATFSALLDADSAMQDDYQQLPESSLSKGLGLQDLLNSRVQQRLADWQRRTGLMMKALPLLRATPNAKGLQWQIETTLQSLLQPSKSLGVLSGSHLPVHRPGLAPTALSVTPTVVPSYADPNDPLPQADDLLPSGEVQFSAGVLGKAQSLGYRYTDLFDFVRSEVRTEWSSGSTQSPDRTLHRAAGNDIEQASLLISLLRASGAAARYVVGVIEVPTGDLAQQIGVPESSVGRALSAAGIANRPISAGGRVTAYQLRHVWVSARVPYGNYRGTVADGSEPTWIPLMPAVKPAVFDAGVGVYARVSHDMSAWLEGQLGSVSEVLPWDTLRLAWSTALATLQPPLALSDVASRYAQNADTIGLLPASTPYPVVAVLAEYSQLPDGERQWLHVRLRDPENSAEPLLMEGKFALSALVSERFTLAFLPATVEDQHMTNANGALGAFPLNLIRLRPSLMSEGLPAQPGRGEVSGGSLLEVEIELQTPNGSVQHRQRVIAGSIAGFAIDAHGDAQMEAEAVDSDGSIPSAGVVLNRFAQRYLAEWAKAEVESAEVMGVRILRPAPALVIVAPRVDPVGVAGLIDRLDFQGVTLDAALRPLEPITLHADARIESDWLRLIGLQGSALESRLYEQLWGVASVSADRLLQQAAAQGASVLHLSTQAELAALAAHPETVRDEIAHWLAQGMTIQIPQNPQHVDTWQGSAWRVQDPEQGADGYFLSGGYAGGSTATAPGLWYFQDLVAVLSNPYAEPPNEDPLAGAIVQIAIGSQNQVQSAGQYYEQPLAALVLDITGRPVQGAAVTFRVREGDATLGANGLNESAHVTTDRTGTARVTAKAPEHGQDLYFRYLTDDAGWRKRAYVSNVAVTTTSARGELRAGQDLHLLMVAGPLHELRIEPAPGRISTIWVPLAINGELLGVFNGWTVVMPRIQTVATNVFAEDAFGNRVGSQLLSISTVDNSQEDRCDYLMPETGEPILPGAVFTTASLCPGYGPFLEANSCLTTQMETRTNEDGVLDLNLVPSNRVRVATTLNVAADGVLATHTVKTTLYGIPPHGPDSCVGIQGLDNVAVVEAAVPDVQRVAKVGELFPRDRQVGYFVETQTVPASIIPIDPVGEDGTNALSFDVRGGTLGSLRRTGFNWFEFDVTAGATPGKVEIFADFPVSASTHFEQHLSPGWAVRLDAPIFEPSIPQTDEFGRLTQDLEIRPGLLPLDYFPQEVRLVLSDADSGFEINCESPKRGGCILYRGTYFPADTLRVHYIVNPNSENPLVSEDFSVDANARIVAGYGGLLPGEPVPSLDRLAGERFPARIEIQTEIDTQTDYVCHSGNRFMFALGYAAQVDLEIFNLDQNGARAGSHLLVLDNASYEAGVYEEDLGLARLPFGVYEFEIRARTEGDSETRTGYLIHREKRRGSLPLAHSVVKGVDVHDGHAVLSAEDIVIGGRGPGLRFSRTYSSHSGDDPTLLGRGWQSELDAAVVRDSCDTYIVTGAAGQGQRYVPDGSFPDGSPRYRPGNGFHGTLRRLADGSFDFYSKDGTHYHFAEGDVSGVRLSYIEDPSGNRISYEYGLIAGQRVITRMVDGAGRALALDYETLALTSEVNAGDVSVPMTNYRTLLTAVRGPGSLIVRYHYDAAGNLIKVTRGERTGGADETQDRIEEYAYHDYGGMWLPMPDDTTHFFHLGYRLTRSQVSSSNSQRDYTWQVGWSAIQIADGSVFPIPELRVETLSETDGGTIGFAYEGLRPLTATATTVTDARNNSSRYEMNRLGATERLTTPAGITLTEWDLLHLQPSAETDVLGTRTSWTHDEHGNRLSETRVHENGTLTRQWQYVAPEAFAVPIKDRVQRETDARAIDTEYSYDPQGRRLTRTRGGVTEIQQYDAHGDLVGSTDGSGALVTYLYDVYGNRTGATDALGSRQSASFDVRNRKLSETTGAGELTEFRYDALDRVRSVTHALGSRRIDYDDAQRTRIETDELGQATTFVHDAQGRLIAQHNALSDVRTLSYDANGNLLTESDFRGNLTQHTYDAANRRLSTAAPLQRTITYQYNALGQVTGERTEGGDSVAREVQTRYAHPLNLPTLQRALIGEGEWAETARRYDGNGNLIEQRDAEGRVTTQTYDARDRLIQIDAPAGRVETFAYDGADRRIASTLNTSPVQSRAWDYDVRGRQTRYSDATGARWEQSYDLADRLVTRSDPLGGTLSYSYDDAGRLVRESGPRGGQFTAYTLDAAGQRIGIGDAAGREIVNTYDALHRLTDSRDEDGLIERRGYDADGHLIERENGLDEVTRFTYNALGYETRRDLPPNQAGARHQTTVYGIHGEVLAETDANGHTTTHTYDGLGRRVRSELPSVSSGGSARRWTYDRVGNVLSYRDAEGREQQTSYTARNQPAQQTDPTPPGTTQHWEYDVAGNLLRHTDRRGIEHRHRYDGENRAIEHHRDGLRIESLSFDAAGRVRTRSDARGEETQYSYDAGGSVLSETRALGFVQRWTYTAWGGKETWSDADGLTTGYVYDARQRLIEESDPAGHTTTHTYDAADRRIGSTRPGDAAWRYAYDPDGHLIEVESPERHRTVYTHDQHGNRIEQRDAEGVVTRYDYDARHRLIAIDHPIGGDEGFAYNAEGELTAHRDRSGQQIEITRDGLGRVTERRYSAAAAGEVAREVFELDGDGQPTTLSQYGESDGPHHITRRYDGQGRLVEEVDRFQQRSQWGYDEVGNRLSLRDPAGSTTTQPDRLNRTARLSSADGSSELHYSPAGRLQHLVHPNGARSETRYDNAGRIERLTHYQNDSEVARFEYAYDARGNRTEERRIDAQGNQRTTYAYDRDDRLTGTTVTASDNTVTETTYELDAVGNRRREHTRRDSITVSDIAYHYQAHQRLSDTHDSVSGLVTEYSYDDRGHLISETRHGQTTTYRPNAQDRLATLTLPGAPPVDYRYDPEGKRIERRTPSEVTRFGWDGAQLRRETNVANNLQDSHDWAAGRILQSRHLSTPRYAQHDAQRSPIRWSHASGIEQGQARYDAWGNTTTNNPELPRIAYTGHYLEREGDRYYAQQRYYQPRLGRFNRTDPWQGNPLSPITLNKYLYGNGNPLAFVDPDGRYGQFFDGTWNDDRPGTMSAGTQTNVLRLYGLYDEQIGGRRDYQPGVGTSWISKVPGGATGLGARSRIDAAYENLVTWYNSQEARDMRANDPDRWESARQIDVFGFSRGAAQAREFANVVRERGILNHETGKNFEGVNVRFLGLFDTVGSMGVPGNGVNLTYDLKLDPDFVRNARHAVAADEFRRQFDLSSISASDGEMASEGFEERYFRGTHSDIGGGNAPGSQGKPNSLARATLHWMHREASAAGVPLNEIFGDDSAVPDLDQLSEEEARALLIHDSRRGVTGTLERLENRQRRTIYYPASGKKETASRAELIERARAGDRGEAQVVKEGEGQLILEPVQSDD